MFNKENSQMLELDYCGETLLIIPWGHGLRVHDSFYNQKIKNWALTETVENDDNFKIEYTDKYAEIINGQTKAIVDTNGKITFFNSDNKKLLEEYWRERKQEKKRLNENQYINVKVDSYSSALKIKARDFQSNQDGDYQAVARFEANNGEKIYGMGQYQQEQLNLKGCHLELAQRNSQTTIPFYLSNKGYGFLWNNPGIGEVTFANNITEWKMVDTDCIDYWICAEETPKKILSAYADVTGHVPDMPKFALGLWQSKLRYRTQEEVLNVAHKYYDLGIQLSFIVIDYFHWTYQGDFKFDSRYFPDPKKMVDELNDLGIKLMVSVWPNIDQKSENYQEMSCKNYLVKSDRGNGITMTFQGNTTFFDATNKDAENFVWDKIKKNYYDKGIHFYWLDEAEPEYSTYDFNNHRLKLGRNTKIGNIYPKLYLEGFYENEAKLGQREKISLVRSAWAGSQKYGALLWSGDIDTSFRSLKYQYQAGLNVGMAGIPWWTTDIGGFHGGSKDDEKFRELLIRWFEFATFCPILRMHGDRNPHTYPVSNCGGGKEGTGAGNEIWSFGQEAFEIMRKFIDIRQQLKPDLIRYMEESHKNGYPVMRTLFFNFPDDERTWNITDEHMLGDDYLVAPIFEYGCRERKVYLPQGARWKNLKDGSLRDGGRYIKVTTKIDEIPIFKKID